VRLLLSGLVLLGLSLPLAAQSPETGEGPEGTTPRAQPVVGLGDPGASQDAEAAREKLLKAADQVDLMESNSEATKASVDGLKSTLTQLSDQNAALKAQVSTLQDTVAKQQDELDKIEAGRAKERQALIDEVSALLAEKTSPHHTHPVAAAEDDDTATPPKKHTATDQADAPPPAPHATAPLAPPPESSGPVADKDGADATSPTDPAGTPSSPSTDTKPAAAATAATVHPRKGYYHVVAAHETLSLICAAYRDHGVAVTVAQIRRANGLTSKSELKVGQKLFIPQPSA
jgi:LysM repeat protein